MRAGLELRRCQPPRALRPLVTPDLPVLPAVPAIRTDPAPLDFGPLHGSSADLLNHPLASRRGLSGRVLTLVRRVFRKLLRPWLDAQTRFNLAAAGGVAESARACRALASALHLVCERIQTLDSAARTLHAHVHQVTERLNEVPDSLAALRTWVNDCAHQISTEQKAQEAHLRAVKERGQTP